MNTFYLNQRILYGQKYTNISSYRFMNNEEGQHCIMAVGNCIELYKVFVDGLSLQKRYEFQANILKLEVIPSQNHTSDYVWILDSRGRFGCWIPQKGLEVVSNQILLDGYCQGQNSDTLQIQSLQIMSGLTCDFEDTDTVGSIFFTVKRKIIFLEFIVSKQGIIIGKISEEKIADQMQIRCINWIRNSLNQCFLGIIGRKKNQQTTLSVYRFVAIEKMLDSKVVWEFSKKNLLNFRAQSNGDILITSYDQVALHSFKMSHPIKCYRTKGNYGQGFCLNDGFYGHFGKELVIFSKDRLRTFSDFSFPNKTLTQNQAFIESQQIGVFQGGAMVSLISDQYEVYILRISTNTCEVIKHNRGIMSVSSFREIEPFTDKFVIVGSSTQTLHEVIVAEKIEALQVEKDQKLLYVVDTLISTEGGNYLFVGCREVNFVLRLTKTLKYQFYFYLPLGTIITARSNFLVLDHGVFQVDYQSQKFTPVFKSVIVLSQIIDDNCYFLTEKGVLTIWNHSNDTVKIIDEKSKADYCWGSTLTTSALITANIQTPSFLKLISDESIQSVPINGHTLVTSLSSVTYKTRKEHMKMDGNLDQQLLIGYSDGQIHFQTHNGIILSTFSLFCSNLVHFERMKQNEVFVLCGNKQYILSYQKTGCKLTDVHLSAGQAHITSIVSIQKLNWLLYLEQNSGSQTLKQANVLSRNSEQRFTTLKTGETIPFVVSRESSIIIVWPKKIEQYDLHSKKVKKEGFHSLEKVNALDQIMKGIIIAGIGTADVKIILVLNQFFQTVHTFQLDLKRPLIDIKSIKNTNNFFIFSDNKVTLNKIEPSGYLKTLFGSEIQLQTHSVDLCQQASRFLINDPERFCSLFDYENTITETVNFLPSFEVIHASFIGQNLLVSDERGKIQIFGVDRDQILFHRSIFVKKASLQLWSPILFSIKRKNGTFILTEDLSIYRVQEIERDEFDILRRLQERCVGKESEGNCFSYWPWRAKTNWDKMIDGDLLLLKIGENSMLSEEVEQEWNYVMDLLSI